MGKSVAHKFKKMAIEMGFEFEDYKPYADELEEWCQEHLAHLESKFRWKRNIKWQKRIGSSC